MNKQTPKSWTATSHTDTIASVAVLATAVLIVLSGALSGLVEDRAPAAKQAQAAAIHRA